MFFRLVYEFRQTKNKCLSRLLSVRAEEIPDALLQMMHGRRNKERRDSVTKEILLDRYNHQEKIETMQENKELLRYLEDHGLGVKRRRNHVYQKLPVTSPLNTTCSTTTGAGGTGSHVSSATNQWPLFEHLLPEIAFAGHSNSGKSTLVNAMVGVAPRKGPASVSDRAGWTDQICFYKLGKRPPVMHLVDFPGYGHAVATPAEKRSWTHMTRDYLQQREILSMCCVLVDCTRGLCEQDKSFLRLLSKTGVPRLVILTKADQLDSEALAGSISIVAEELRAIPPAALSMAGGGASGARIQGPLAMDGFEDIVPVSASTGAGVQTLWKLLRSVVDQSVPSGHASSAAGDVEGEVLQVAVREHVRASELRRRYAAASFYAGKPPAKSMTGKATPLQL